MGDKLVIFKLFTVFDGACQALEDQSVGRRSWTVHRVREGASTKVRRTKATGFEAAVSDLNLARCGDQSFILTRVIGSRLARVGMGER
jgi:hypothetical protein